MIRKTIHITDPSQNHTGSLLNQFTWLVKQQTTLQKSKSSPHPVYKKCTKTVIQGKGLYKTKNVPRIKFVGLYLNQEGRGTPPNNYTSNHKILARVSPRSNSKPTNSLPKSGKRKRSAIYMSLS